MNNCLCCSQTMFRQIRRGQVYWFCPHCRQEMPTTLSAAILGKKQRGKKLQSHLG